MKTNKGKDVAFVIWYIAYLILNVMGLGLPWFIRNLITYAVACGAEVKR